MKENPLKQFTALRESLLKRKVEIENELSSLNAVLGCAEVSPGTVAKPVKSATVVAKQGPRRRAENALSLLEAVLTVTKSKPLPKAEILTAVDKLGYKFSAKSPMNSLNTLLYTSSGIKKSDGKFGPK